MIIDYLQDGVSDDLKIHIKRRLATITNAVTPAVFLKIARTETELQKKVSSTQTSSSLSPSYFGQVAITTRRLITANNHCSALNDSLNNRGSTIPFQNN